MTSGESRSEQNRRLLGGRPHMVRTREWRPSPGPDLPHQPAVLASLCARNMTTTFIPLLHLSDDRVTHLYEDTRSSTPGSTD